MDYAASSQAGSNNTARETRPLESIALAAQRVNSATVGIQHFLDRFHGPTPEVVSKEPMAPDPAYHAASLDRLFAALDRLETRVEALNTLG